MNKLRILPLASICVLLSIPALAQLTTIGPHTQGVTESLMTLREAGPGPYAGSSLYLPVLTLIPLGSRTGSLVETSVIDVFPFSNCFSGCLGASGGISPGYFTELAVSFSKPVSFVDVLQLQPQFNGGGAFAYDAQGQLIASCYGLWEYPGGVTGFTSPGNKSSECYTLVSPLGDTATATTSFALSAPDISLVIAGGYLDVTDGVTAVEFRRGQGRDVPEPGTFALLAVALAGLAVRSRRKLSEWQVLGSRPLLQPT